jgi:hypothetical protein
MAGFEGFRSSAYNDAGVPCVTPAMAAGVTDRLWEVSDIVALWEAVEPKAGKRGTYKKQNSD